MRNNMKRFLPWIGTILITSVIVVGLNMLFGSVAAFGQSSIEPQTNANAYTGINTSFNPTVQARVIETNTVQYVEKPVTVVKYVDRVQKAPLELRNFKDLAELQQWLKDVNTNTTTIYLERPGAAIDCDDFALALQRKALEGGFLMSFQIIEPGRYNSLFEGAKIPPNTLHAINLAIIGNNVYYIEPQTGEVVLAAQLD